MANHKETRSLLDMISEIGHRKRRAAQARFAGRPAGVEAPRDVYLCACGGIAAHFQEAGYKYAKSGQHCRRRCGDFIFQIGFQSSSHNVAGEHVGLSIYGTVFSPKIKKWRAKYAELYPSDAVAGGQIGNLQSPHSWLAWDLADPSTRGATIADAVATIEQLALPYFAHFGDLGSLIPLLVEQSLPSMEIDHVIAFLMCFADKKTARLAAVKFLQRRPDLVANYLKAMEQFPSRETDRPPSGYAQQLAFASIVLEFGNHAERHAEQ